MKSSWLIVLRIKIENISCLLYVIGHEAKSRAPKKFHDQGDYTKFYNEIEFIQLRTHVVASVFAKNFFNVAKFIDIGPTLSYF